MALVYRPKAIINTGVAGGIGKGVSVGDVVVSEDWYNMIWIPAQ